LGLVFPHDYSDHSHQHHGGSNNILIAFGLNASFAAHRLLKDDRINQRMVMLHLMEDILGWGAVFIVSIVLIFYPLYILDSILSLLISLLILKGVYKNLIKVGEIFLEKFPKEIQLDNIKSEILKIKHIEDVHGVRGWSIDSNQVSLSLHISVLGNTTVFEVDELREQIELILKEQSVHYSSIEFESTTHQCIDKNQ